MYAQKSYGNRRDANEPSIFAIIRSYGFSVHPLDTPADALVGFKDVTRLVEVKDGPNAKFTETQVKFRDGWCGDYHVLRTDEEAHEWCKAIRSGCDRMTHVNPF